MTVPEDGISLMLKSSPSFSISPAFLSHLEKVSPPSDVLFPFCRSCKITRAVHIAAEHDSRVSLFFVFSFP